MMLLHLHVNLNADDDDDDDERSVFLDFAKLNFFVVMLFHMTLHKIFA